ncbi:hypothetical protein T439DRAFT_368532 [Meredithblackwellia eburnea MCA 4105]
MDPPRTPSPKRHALANHIPPTPGGFKDQREGHENLIQDSPEMHAILDWFHHVDEELTKEYRRLHTPNNHQSDILGMITGSNPGDTPKKISTGIKTGYPPELALTAHLGALLLKMKESFEEKNKGSVFNYQFTTVDQETKTGADLLIEINLMKEPGEGATQTRTKSRSTTAGHHFIFLLQAKCIRGNKIDFTYKPAGSAWTQAKEMWEFVQEHPHVSIIPAFLVYGPKHTAVIPCGHILRGLETNLNSLNSFNTTMTQEIMKCHAEEKVNRFTLPQSMVYCMYNRYHATGEYEGFPKRSNITLGRELGATRRGAGAYSRRSKYANAASVFEVQARAHY